MKRTRGATPVSAARPKRARCAAAGGDARAPTREPEGLPYQDGAGPSQQQQQHPQTVAAGGSAAHAAQPGRPLPAAVAAGAVGGDGVNNSGGAQSAQQPDASRVAAADRATPAARPGAAGPITPEVPATTPGSLGPQTQRRAAAARASAEAPASSRLPLSQQARRRAALLLLDSSDAGALREALAADGTAPEPPTAAATATEAGCSAKSAEAAASDAAWAASVLQSLEARLAAAHASAASKRSQRQARLLLAEPDAAPRGPSAAPAAPAAAAAADASAVPAASAAALEAGAASCGEPAARGGGPTAADSLPEQGLTGAAAEQQQQHDEQQQQVLPTQQPDMPLQHRSGSTAATNPARRRAALLLQSPSSSDAPPSSWQLFKPLLAAAIGAASEPADNDSSSSQRGEAQPAAPAAAAAAGGATSAAAGPLSRRRAQLLGVPAAEASRQPEAQQQQAPPSQPASEAAPALPPPSAPQQPHEQPQQGAEASVAAAASAAGGTDLATPLPFANCALTPSTAARRKAAATRGLAALCQQPGGAPPHPHSGDGSSSRAPTPVDATSLQRAQGDSPALPLSQQRGAEAVVSAGKPPRAPPGEAPGSRSTSLRRQALKRPLAGSARANRALQLGTAGGAGWLQPLLSMAGVDTQQQQQQQQPAPSVVRAEQGPSACDGATTAALAGKHGRRRAQLLQGMPRQQQQEEQEAQQHQQQEDAVNTSSAGQPDISGPQQAAVGSGPPACEASPQRLQGSGVAAASPAGARGSLPDSPAVCAGAAFLAQVEQLINSLAPPDSSVSPQCQRAPPAAADGMPAQHPSAPHQAAACEAHSMGAACPVVLMGVRAGTPVMLSHQQQQRVSPATPVTIRAGSQLQEDATAAPGPTGAQAGSCQKQQQHEQQQQLPAAADAARTSGDTAQHNDQAALLGCSSPCELPPGSSNKPQPAEQGAPASALMHPQQQQQRRPALGTLAQRRAALLPFQAGAGATADGVTPPVQAAGSGQAVSRTVSRLDAWLQATGCVGASPSVRAPAACDGGRDAGSRDADQSIGSLAACWPGKQPPLIVAKQPQALGRLRLPSPDISSPCACAAAAAADDAVCCALAAVEGGVCCGRRQQEVLEELQVSPSSVARASLPPASSCLAGVSRTMAYVRAPAGKGSQRKARAAASSSAAARAHGSGGSSSSGGILHAAMAPLTGGELPDGAGTCPVKETLEAAVVAAHLDLQLAAAAAAGEVWAACDLAGLPLDASGCVQRLQAAKDRYADARGRLVRCRSPSDVARLDRQLSQEWLLLKGMRQRTVDAARECNKQGILRRASLSLSSAAGVAGCSPVVRCNSLPDSACWMAGGSSTASRLSPLGQPSAVAEVRRIRFASSVHDAQAALSPPRSAHARRELLLRTQGKVM